MDERGMRQDHYRRGFIPYALAAFMVGIAGGFSAVLGPAFVQDVGLPYSNTTWTALAQAVSTAVCAPVLGKLGDMLGLRRTLLLGIGIYTAGNVMTALAGSLPAMMLARFTVGIGSAAIAPVVLAYIVSEFPEDRMGRGFSLYMLISSAAVVFGPALGGLMIREYGWRGMIWVCVLICAVTFLLCLLFREHTEGKRTARAEFDAAGATLVLVFFGLFLSLPSVGQIFGWRSPLLLWLAAAAAVSLAGLVAVERRADNPVLPAGFVRRKRFVISVLILFLTQGLMQANMTNMIVFVNNTQPENAVISGYAISIMYLGMSLGAVILGPLADRLEPKYVLTGSLLLTGVGCGMMLLFSENTDLWLLALSLGSLGFGQGGNGTILLKVVFDGLSSEQSGGGAGIYGLFRDLAAPFGVAVLVPMFTNQVSRLEMEMGIQAASVSAVRVLACVEIGCVAAGILTVWMLPRIHKRRPDAA